MAILNWQLHVSYITNTKLNYLYWLINKFRVSARLGEWDTNRDVDCDDDICSDPIVDIAIERLIPHSNYKPFAKSQVNDIALIRLAKSISFTDYIKPICLPVDDRLQNVNYDGIGLQTVGWGYTSSVRNGK